jgi:transposase
MMRPAGEVKVYLHREPIDMRKGRNGLAALVREGMQHDPFAPEALYVFVGRRYDALKILGWDRNGFCKPSTQDPRCGLRTETTLLPMASLVRS